MVETFDQAMGRSYDLLKGSLTGPPKTDEVLRAIGWALLALALTQSQNHDLIAVDLAENSGRTFNG